MIPMRKVGSVDGSKRIADLQNIVNEKMKPGRGIISKSPGNIIKPKLQGIGDIYSRPPMPIIPLSGGRVEKKHYIGPNPMRQAGLAVVEKYHIPIRPLKDNIIV